jgi:heme/copper-type cytochrome/quinol oxidase subunit 2
MVAIFAVVALGIVAVIAVANRDNGTTMMGTNGMPGSMMGNGQMMNGPMMNGPMTGHGASSPTIPGAREIAVTATSFKFDPNEIHVRAGEDVTIVLTASDTVHDFTIDELAFHVAASPGQQGRGSFHAPATAGRYTAYCSVAGHRQAGMTASVVVDPA